LAFLACLSACGSNGDEDTALQTEDVASGRCELTVDAAQTEHHIPATYVGMALSRGYISGDGMSERLFNPSAPWHGQLVNLLHESGVKHIRVLSDGARDTPDCKSWFSDPSAAEDADFFATAAAAGLGDRSVIYSLHLFNEENRSDNVTAVDHLLEASYSRMIESFAFDNEPDWEWLYRPNPCFDPSVPDRPAYFAAWNRRQSDVVQAMQKLGVPAVPFSGPDTGSNYPVLGGKYTGVDNEAFTLAFAQSHKINLATQHYYGATNTVVDTWTAGTNYVAGDAVADPGNRDVSYRCLENDPGSSVAPHRSPRWEIYPPLWDAGKSYDKYAVVQDPKDLPHVYQAVQPVSPNSGDPKGSSLWTLDPNYGYPSARQMALHMLDPQRLVDWQKLLDGALAEARGWPRAPRGGPLPYRFTEANAYSGGQDERSHNLATALWSLDFFHWWAARGAQGVDPFTRVVQYNAPIFQDPTTKDLSAAPYAYGMRAFSEGSNGTTVKPEAVQLSVHQDRITAYAVVNASHLYVTIVNKTFRSVAGVDEAITLRPSHFGPKSARALVLEAADGERANAGVSSVVLGGAKIPAAGAFAGTWSPVKVGSDGSLEITVRAASAVVLDLSR
jgi:hypothetical protein